MLSIIFIQFWKVLRNNDGLAAIIDYSQYMFYIRNLIFKSIDWNLRNTYNIEKKRIKLDRIIHWFVLHFYLFFHFILNNYVDSVRLMLMGWCRILRGMTALQHCNILTFPSACFLERYFVLVTQTNKQQQIYSFDGQTHIWNGTRVNNFGYTL